MKTITHLVIAFAALMSSISGLSAAEKTIGYFEAIEKDGAPVVGQQYYLRHCLKYEDADGWPTTNYWTDKSILVPINSPVVLESFSSKDMKIKIQKTGQVVKIENVQKYSQKDMPTIAKAMLAPNPVPIDQFDESLQKNIRNGVLSLGMTKEQVVMTRGYPPGHKTPNLELDTWVYWNNRFVQHTLVFKDGVLAEGRGLQ